MKRNWELLTTGGWGIGGILIFALLLRVIWALVQPRTPEAIARLPDQQEYLSLGQNLLNDGSLSFLDPRFEQASRAYRMPGYPAVIAASGGSVLIVRILQSIVDTSTVLAVYLIASAWPISGGQSRDSHKFGFIAAALIAVNPFLIYFSGLILSETSFTALLIWGLCFLIRRRFSPGAIFLIAACYFRPAAIIIAPVIAAVAMVNPVPGVAYRLLPALRRSLIAAFIIGGLTVVALIPWAIRNHQRLGSWIWTTTNGGITLYDGFNPGATGASDQRFLANLPAVRSMNEVDRSRFLGELARDWAWTHLSRLPLLSLRKVLRSWSPIPLSSEFGRPIYRIISAMYAIPFDFCLLVGLLSRRIRRGMKLLLITPAVLITLIEVMSVGSIRYRIPVEVPLAVVAAAGAAVIFTAAVRMTKPKSRVQTLRP